MQMLVEVSPGVWEQRSVRGRVGGGLWLDASPNLIDITPSDVTVYDPPLTGIRVGTAAGDVAVVSNGVTVTIPAVEVAETLPGSITQVLATGTTATGITGWQR